MREAGGGIPIVAQEERRTILALPPTVSVHTGLYAKMPFATAVEVVNAPPLGAQTGAGVLPGGAQAPGAAPATALRVMAWNAARCTNVDAFARFIQSSRPHVVLLTEMDWGMARSGQAHTARDLAARLSMGYAYAVEFLELGLGDEQEKAAHAGAVNEVGYHGAAILCDRSLSSARRIPLEESGGWFDDARGQRRVGGRMALCAAVTIGAAAVVFCAVHLESESDPSERAREMRLLFDELDRAWPGLPVVVGGDLNTFSISGFADPVAHEPLFALARERGYDWKESNLPGAPSHGKMKIDWFLTRGLTAHDPDVLPAREARSREALSDHDAIVVSIAVEPGK